jgi:glycosyltransferase involved in cell wall biosynthesis
MKILHVIPYMNPIYGGPPEALKSMVDVALQGGHDVNVYATSSGYKDLESLSGMAESTNHGGIYNFFEPSFPVSWFYSRDLFGQLNRNIDQIDLMHLHVPFTAPFSIAAEMAMKRGVPFVATPHGLLDKWSMAQKSWKKFPYYHFIEKRHLLSARLLHVTSSLEERDVLRLGLGVPIENIPLSVADSNIFSKIDMGIELPHLLFIGRLHPVKSIPTILKAIKLLSDSGMDVVFDLAGSGTPSYEKYLRDLIKRDRIESRVIWHGHVDLIKKQNLYKKCNMFVMPSFHENFGLAAAEAMAAGIPVILSDQVGLAPDVKKWEAGSIIPTDNAVALAHAVKDMLHGGRLDQMSVAAKRLIDCRFSQETFSKDLLSMYSRALGGHINKSE